MKRVFLCSISNVTSGACREDCAFCTQSVKYNTNVPIYKNKAKEKVLEEAKILARFGASGFCLVISGLGLDSKKCEYIASLATSLKAELPEMLLIACCGKADVESLRYLKNSGIDSYNHNLETAKSYFYRICTTHSFDSRVETCQNVLSAGLKLCSGGIFGIGESVGQRIEFLKALRGLNPHSSPINFFIANAALPIKENPISKDEALECIMLAREILSDSILMLAGGREVVFGDNQKEIFDYGINAIVLGDYLTTNGEAPKKDISMLKKYNLKIAHLKQDRQCV